MFNLIYFTFTIILMYVSDTFISFIDKLPGRSVLQGRTGSCFGLLTTAGFIVVSFIIFIWPVIFYFKGDYIQGTFISSKSEGFELYTGCDFKLAIFFYEKATGKLANHIQTKQFLNTRILYTSPDRISYYSQVMPCSAEYFAEMEDKPHDFKPEDCFIAPDGLGYTTKLVNGYLSVFGFKFEPICHDPFMCTYLIEANSTISTRRMQFFRDHYFVLRFTSQYVNQYGELRHKFYESYSTEWDGEDSTLPIMWTLLESQKIFMDNSIMPWLNNQTKLFTNYMGATGGQIIDDLNLITYGSFAMLTTTSIQRVYFREYKKLDWLLGMLGGGLLALYLIFWILSSFASTLKQKKHSCQSTLFILDDDGNQIRKPQFSSLWYPSTFLPCKLPCFRKQNKLIHANERMIDIAELVKKQKIARKNLELAKIKVNFEPRQLEFDDSVRNQFSEEQIKYEMPIETIQKLQANHETADIYSNSLSMLNLYKSCEPNAENKEVADRINKIIENLKYSQYKVPQFQSKSKYDKLSKIGKYISKAIKLFDLFGAKPNFIAPPHSSSIVSCLLTLLILVCAILTFALTLKNMGVVRTYWDEIFVPPQHQKLTMTTGDDFRSVICFPSGAFNNSLVISNDRIVDVQFYQYKRSKNYEEYVYHDTIPMQYQNNPYFDKSDPYYREVNLTYCMRPQNNIQVQTYGDQYSEDEAYVGFRLTPRCFGTPTFCASNVDATNRKFYNFLNSYKVTFYFSDAKYYPDIQGILYAPSVSTLTDQKEIGHVNFTKSIEQVIMMSTLQLIDNTPAWIMGEYPKPYKQILTASPETSFNRLMSIDTSAPEYRIRYLISGRVIRVILQAYKIDFLFATIGGCFVFFYFFFGGISKAYNNYKIKSKLAEVLYLEELPLTASVKEFVKWMRIPFFSCQDQVVQKIEADIDCTNLAKNLDNVYRLSAFTHEDPLYKDLSLIFFKERVKIDDEVLVQKNIAESDDEQEDDDNDFMTEWQIKRKLRHNRKNQSNAVENSSQLDSENIAEKEVEIGKKTDKEPVRQIAPTTRSIQKCGKNITNYDMFSNNSQLTFGGSRTVKSVFGGCCCIILLIFICVLASHFVTIYFSDLNRVSINKVVDQRSEARKIKLSVGKNFKLAVSFSKIDDFDFFDVRNLVKDVGLSVVKYKVVKLQGANTQTKTQIINFQHCLSNYLDNFVNPYDHSQYFSKLTNAYCLPDGSELNLYGSTDDDTRQYFSIRIYNKYLNQNASYGFQKVQELLSNYIPKYHMSTPMVDYRANGHQIYQMIPRTKTFNYLTTQSATFNVTIVKSTIKFDTTVLPSSEPSNVDSYDIKGQFSGTFENFITDNTDRFYDINFYPEEMYNEYTIKKIKANQIFGIIGGCIAFLFFGIGCIPRSYNEFRLRYLIGCKVYTIVGKKRAPKQKKQKGKRKERKNESQNELQDELSDWGLLLAWIQSYIAYFTGNYKQYSSIKRYALIESRISRDINLVYVMKNLHACESAINSSDLFRRLDLNLCRVFPKHIVWMNQDNEASHQFKKTVKGEQQLVFLTQEHEFTEWQLHRLMKAKQTGIPPEILKTIFADRWLEKFLGASESAISSKIQQEYQMIKFQESHHKINQSDPQINEQVIDDL